jgi:phenylacetate-CoA ligase
MKIIDNIYFRLKYIINYNIDLYPIVNKLNESQYWPREKIEEYQEQKILQLYDKLKHIEYYKKYKIIKLMDIENCAEITKNELRNNMRDMVNDKYNKLTQVATSGSTGFPIIINLNSLALAYREAGRIRFREWWGLNPDDRWIFLWGRSSIEKKKKILHQMREKINIMPKKGIKINIFELNNESVKSIYSKVKEFKPKYLKGYKSAIYQFAKLIRQNQIRAEELKLLLIIVTSEILYPDEREFMESVFHCRVANEYGAVDAGLIAYECPKGGMHIFEESVLVKINRNHEILTTEFHNFSTPIINYKIGDKIRLSKESCSCGRTLALIENIEGRIDDTIMTPNGEEINHLYFYYLFKDLDHAGFSNSISQYKITQKKNTFSVYIIKGERFESGIINYIEKRMKKDIGEEIKIKILYVNQIPLEKSGKMRHFHREKL